MCNLLKTRKIRVKYVGVLHFFHDKISKTQDYVISHFKHKLFTCVPTVTSLSTAEVGNSVVGILGTQTGSIIKVRYSTVRLYGWREPSAMIHHSREVSIFI